VSKALRIASVAAGSLLLLGGGFLGGIYWAAQHVPTFYAQALEQEPAQAREAKDELLENATALASEAQRGGPWSALFTAEQLNGWLAVDLPENYPKLLPPEVRDPRVRLSPGLATIACRYQDGAVATVFSLKFELYLAEPNVVALKINSARAGAIPLPLAQVLDGVRQAAEDMQLHLRWARTDGDPVALISIPPTIGKHKVAYHLESLEIRDDALFLAGHTGRDSEEPGTTPLPRTAVADQSPANKNSQR
jgi:hypothetical protein